MTDIIIKGKAYKAKAGLRSLFLYENIKGEPYAGKTLVDSYILSYTMILAGSADVPFDFNEFIDYCDEDPTIYFQCMNELRKWSQKENDESTGDKKKVND